MGLEIDPNLGAGETIVAGAPMMVGIVKMNFPAATVPMVEEGEDVAALFRREGAAARIAVTFGGLPFTAEMMDALPDLKFIAAYGAGFDGLDMDAVRARGIQVTNAGDTNCEEVADYALGLGLAARREIVISHHWVLSGDWAAKGRRPLAHSFSRSKVGIVGLGNIGREIAKRCAGFDCEVRWWGPRDKPGEPLERMESVVALAEWADNLFLACPGGDDSYRLVDRAVIDALGREGALVTVARGSVIHEDALIAALKEGRLGAAGIDVFEEEPTPHERWQGVPNVVLSPHHAGGSIESMDRMRGMVRENVRRFLAGEPLLNRVD